MLAFWRRRRVAAIAVWVAAVLVTSRAAAQHVQAPKGSHGRADYFKVMSEQTSPAVGRAYYERYCADCHGVNADGAGPMARLLTTRPSDLRTLGQRYGRPLPIGTLAQYIDGRKMAAAHGRREMPVWGEAFDTLPWMGGSGRENALRNRLARIIYFLDTI